MAVHLRVRDRADFLADAARAGFSSYTRVIDVQPALLGHELASASVEAFAQCPSCTFVDFLEAQERLDAFEGLAGLRATLRAIPELSRALADGAAGEITAIARRIGATAVIEIATAGRPPRLALPRIRVVRSDDDLAAALADRPRDDEHVLVEPERGGPERLASRLTALAAAGRERASVGYLEHASAVERWSAFVEASAGDPWEPVLFDASRRGLGRIGLAIAFPPCASLQWGANRALEQLRARTDTHFRTARGESSMMCAENVTGYTLVDDVRSVLGGRIFPAMRLAVRWHDLLVVLA